MAIIDDKIRDEKLQYNIDRQAAKKSALSSWKIDKYESLTGEEMLLTDQKRVIKQAKLRKKIWNTNKTIEEEGRKTSQSFKSFNGRGIRINWRIFSKNYENWWN